MNVAVEPKQAAPGHRDHPPGAALRAGGQAERAVHARGAHVERGRDPPLRALRVPRRRPPPRVLPRQPRGRAHHVADRGRAHHRVILALETSCDDTCAAVVTRGRPDRLERDRLAGAAARALRRGRAGDRVAPPPRADRRGDRRRAGACRRAARRRRHGGRHARPGADRRAAGGRLVGEGASRPRGGCRSCRWTISTGTWWRARWARTRSRRPTSASSRAAATRSSRAWMTRPGTRCSGRRWTTLRARPSTRAPACSASAIPAVLPSTGWRARAIPRRSTFPRSAPGELDFSFSGLKTALLYAIRDLGDAGRASAPPIWRPRTSVRSSTRS